MLVSWQRVLARSFCKVMIFHRKNDELVYETENFESVKLPSREKLNDSWDERTFLHLESNSSGLILQ